MPWLKSRRRPHPRLRACEYRCLHRGTCNLSCTVEYMMVNIMSRDEDRGINDLDRTRCSDRSLHTNSSAETVSELRSSQRVLVSATEIARATRYGETKGTSLVLASELIQDDYSRDPLYCRSCSSRGPVKELANERVCGFCG